MAPAVQTSYRSESIDISGHGVLTATVYKDSRPDCRSLDPPIMSDLQHVQYVNHVHGKSRLCANCALLSRDSEMTVTNGR